MKTSTTHTDPEADSQAALWAARLDGSVLSAADRTALDAWLDANPVHRTLLSNYCQFSADLENCLPAMVEAGVVEMPTAAAPARSSRGKFIWASAFAAVAVIALTIWFVQPATQLESVATTAGQRNAITLADGTRVELNAATTLHVELSRHERRVRLTSGEAFFAVTKDASRPFIVETPAGLVRVTGTAFGVQTEGTAKFVVTVLEGSVQVRAGETARDSDAAVTLGAGDRLRLESKGVSVQALKGSALSDALAWREGQVVFVDVPLSDALAQFARYHRRELSASPEAADLRVGGRFSLDDAEGFLSALENILPVKVSREPTGRAQVVITPAR